MRFRKLRIAWSVAWGIVAVLLIALWVRSYWWCDTVGLNLLPTRLVTLDSDEGRLNFEAFDSDVPISATPLDSVPNELERRWRKAVAAVDAAEGHPQIDRFMYCRIHRYPLVVKAYGPHWVVLLTTVTVSILPWLRFKRFSLRTLLIATTLVAVGLGLMAWAAH
jgi:hypothetical protein